MARDVILNIVGTGAGNYQGLGAVEGFPFRAYSVTIQPRTNVDAYFRFFDAGVPNPYMTIKGGGSHTLLGTYNPGDIEVSAPNGAVLEIYISTQPNQK